MAYGGGYIYGNDEPITELGSLELLGRMADLTEESYALIGFDALVADDRYAEAMEDNRRRIAETAYEIARRDLARDFR